MTRSRPKAQGTRPKAQRRRVVVRCIVLCALCLVPCALTAQAVPLEYRVKAGYLFNFAKFVEWPANAPPGPITVCVAGRNVFGEVLDEIIRGETINGRPLTARVVLEPDSGCHVLFVPRGAAAAAYLRAARGAPVLTVGEADDFIAAGGIVNFILDGGNVRFEIDPEKADAARLRISSRLLRLARTPGGM
jgi:hypothetical protein